MNVEMGLTSDASTQWAFVDGLGFNPKDDPETIGLAILILGQVLSPSYCQGTPRVLFDRELGGLKLRHAFYKTMRALI